MKIIKIGAVWCPGCLMMNKIWDKIEKQYPEIECITYDYDMDEERIKKYEVGKILPVTIFIKDGNEVCRLIGEKKESEIIEKIKEWQ